MSMRMGVAYTPYDAPSREQIDDIITFVKFEEGNLLSETQTLWSEIRDNAESGNEYDDDSTMPPLNSKE